MDIGRNEPCPCDSGREYKHCCLASAAAALATESDRLAAQRNAHDWLPSRFGKQKQGEIPEHFPGDVLDAGSADDEHEPLGDVLETRGEGDRYVLDCGLNEWALHETSYERRGSKARAIDWALDARGLRLTAAQRLFLQDVSTPRLRVYEGTAVEWERGLHLRDVHQPHLPAPMTHAVAATRTVRPESLIAARVTEHAGHEEIGSGIYPLTPIGVREILFDAAVLDDAREDDLIPARLIRGSWLRDRVRPPLLRAIPFARPSFVEDRYDVVDAASLKSAPDACDDGESVSRDSAVWMYPSSDDDAPIDVMHHPLDAEGERDVAVLGMSSPDVRTADAGRAWLEHAAGTWLLHRERVEARGAGDVLARLLRHAPRNPRCEHAARDADRLRRPLPGGPPAACLRRRPSRDCAKRRSSAGFARFPARTAGPAAPTIVLFSSGIELRLQPARRAGAFAVRRCTPVARQPDGQSRRLEKPTLLPWLEAGTVRLAVLSPNVSPAAVASPAPHVCKTDGAWDEPARPRRLYRDTWFVGTCGLSLVLVTTRDGLVLLDAGDDDAAPSIDANIRAFGFPLRDGRSLLDCHAHFDHVGVFAQLHCDSGATVVARGKDAEAIERSRGDRNGPQFLGVESFAVVVGVRRVRDGDIQNVGGVEFKAHATHGHAHGRASWARDWCEERHSLHVAYVDSFCAMTDKEYRYNRRARGNRARRALFAVDLFNDGVDLPTAKKSVVVDQFHANIATVAGLPCDLLITPHPDASPLWKRLAVGAALPLVDTEACHRNAATASRKLDQLLAKERLESQ